MKSKSWKEQTKVRIQHLERWWQTKLKLGGKTQQQKVILKTGNSYNGRKIWPQAKSLIYLLWLLLLLPLQSLSSALLQSKSRCGAVTVQLLSAALVWVCVCVCNCVCKSAHIGENYCHLLANLHFSF